MRWKVSNTLFIVAIFLFVVAVLVNYMQVKKSVETSLEKARRIKKEKAEERRKQAQQEEEEEIEEEIIEILNNSKNGETQ